MYLTFRKHPQNIWMLDLRRYPKELLLLDLDLLGF